MRRAFEVDALLERAGSHHMVALRRTSLEGPFEGPMHCARNPSLQSSSTASS